MCLINNTLIRLREILPRRKTRDEEWCFRFGRILTPDEALVKDSPSARPPQ